MTNPESDGVPRVIAAIAEEGRKPAYHRHQLRRLRAEWPTLANALVHLLMEQGAQIPKELRYPPARSYWGEDTDTSRQWTEVGRPGSERPAVAAPDLRMRR